MQLEARNQTPVLCLPSGIRWCRSRAGFWRAMRYRSDVQSTWVADGPESHPCLPGRRCLGDSQAPALPYRAGTVLRNGPQAHGSRANRATTAKPITTRARRTSVANHGGLVSCTPPGPPRGWGNPCPGRAVRPTLRAIPTRVGKSTRLPSGGRRTTGHPHAGGEICQESAGHPHPHGPSPRGWGNPDDAGDDLHGLRAIPTRVGKSCKASSTKPARAGHPHVGGEIFDMAASVEPRSGPSPRGWGNLQERFFLRAPARAIPTRVGKSCRT